MGEATFLGLGTQLASGLGWGCVHLAPALPKSRIGLHSTYV